MLLMKNRWNMSMETRNLKNNAFVQAFDKNLLQINFTYFLVFKLIL